MASIRSRQMALPFVIDDRSKGPSATARRRATELLKQMLIDTVRTDHLPKEHQRERQDPAGPS